MPRVEDTLWPHSEMAGCHSGGSFRLISNSRQVCHAILAWTVYARAFLRLLIQNRSDIAQIFGGSKLHNLTSPVTATRCQGAQSIA